jgi:FtsH-binding integral membrane protein
MTARVDRRDAADRRVPLAAALDAASVVLFVAIGKREHDQDTAIEGLVSTAAPFLLGLLVAWLVVRVWKRPTAWTTGVMIWPITVVVGMVLRSTVWNDGTATAFVIVATAFLGLTLVGWRAALSLHDRRSAS